MAINIRIRRANPFPRNRMANMLVQRIFADLGRQIGRQFTSILIFLYAESVFPPRTPEGVRHRPGRPPRTKCCYLCPRFKLLPIRPVHTTPYPPQAVGHPGRGGSPQWDMKRAPAACRRRSFGRSICQVNGRWALRGLGPGLRLVSASL